MSKTKSRAFLSNPVAMGSIISQLVGGGEFPVMWFDEGEAQAWKQPIGNIPASQYGELRIVIECPGVPQDYWDNAYLIDVKMRVRELWPDLDLDVVFEGSLVGYYAKLVNRKSLASVGTGLDQMTGDRVGQTYYTGPDGQPLRSSYDIDVSKFVIAGTRNQTFKLVDHRGNPVKGEGVKGDNHPEDFAWVVAEEGNGSLTMGVKLCDLMAAAKLTGLVVGYNEDGIVSIN